MSGEIYGALAKVMTQVGAVTKAKKNTQQGYQFRGIDDVVAHVQQVMADAGVICVPRVIEREREVMQTKSGGSMASVRLLVEHAFYAKDGSSVVCTTLGEAMDSGDKASNKAMSAALKYALTETLLIPTYEIDRDTEEQSPELGPRPTPNGVDPVEREVGLILAAAQAARTVADVDALAKRFEALPAPEKARVRPALSARKQELARGEVKA